MNPYEAPQSEKSPPPVGPRTDIRWVVVVALLIIAGVLLYAVLFRMLDVAPPD